MSRGLLSGVYTRHWHKRLLAALSTSVFGPTGVYASQVVRRVIQNKRTLQHNVEIRKMAMQIRLANDMADLRRVLVQSCEPIFDHIEIILSSSGREKQEHRRNRWIYLLRLELTTSAGKQIGHVELGRSAARRGALCVDVQLLARELQSALSAAVERMAPASCPVLKSEVNCVAVAEGLPPETNRRVSCEPIASEALAILHVVGNWADFYRLERLLLSFNAVAPGVRHRVVFAGKVASEQMQTQVSSDLGVDHPLSFVCTTADTDSGEAAELVRGLQPLMLNHRPNWVVAYGNSNASIAAALASARLSIRLAHIEAGRRPSNCNTEQTNGVLIDQLSECLFTCCVSAQQQLIREGVSPEKIQFLGREWDASAAAYQVARVLLSDDDAIGDRSLAATAAENLYEHQPQSF